MKSLILSFSCQSQEKIGIKEEENIYLFVEILMNNHIIERAPSVGFIKIQVPNPEFDKLMWL